MEDSLGIQREAQLYTKEYEKAWKGRVRQRLVFSPPRVHQ